MKGKLVAWPENMNDYDIEKAIIGKSRAIKKNKASIKKFASTDISVLIIGETGTGKEVVAEAIHKISGRAKKNLKAVNCANLKGDLLESKLFGHKQGSFTGSTHDQAGLFKEADKGTLFLDELESMELGSQASLLRVLQDGKIHPVGGGEDKVDVRIIAATQTDPKKLIKEKKLREDLYYRIKTARINIPPLKERKKDIPILADHFIGVFSEKYKNTFAPLTKKQIKELKAYSWPGNVRELISVIEEAFINSEGKKLDIRLDEDETLEEKRNELLSEKVLKQNDTIIKRIFLYFGGKTSHEATDLFLKWTEANRDNIDFLQKELLPLKGNKTGHSINALKEILKINSQEATDLLKAVELGDKEKIDLILINRDYLAKNNENTEFKKISDEQLSDRKKRIKESPERFPEFDNRFSEKQEGIKESPERFPKPESPTKHASTGSSNKSIPDNGFPNKKETTQRQANQFSEKEKSIKQSSVQPPNKEKLIKQHPDKKRTIKKSPNRFPNKKATYKQGGCDRTGVIEQSYGWDSSKEANFAKTEEAKNSKAGCLGMIGRGLLCGTIGSLLPLLLALMFDFPDLASAGVILLFMIIGILIGYLFPDFFGVNSHRTSYFSDVSE